MTRNDLSAKELFDQLNLTDECNYIEAKPGNKISDTVLETVCAFANEPDLGGGYILLGISEDETTLFSSYKITGVSDPDKMQMDLSSRCASDFNLPIRPVITVEKIDRQVVLKVFIPENPKGSKPVYFKSHGLPYGAMRRIGSTDQHCTEDDLRVFYETQESYDQSVLKDTSINDVDIDAVDHYRKLRKEVNPLAEELNYSMEDLLICLGCAKRDKDSILLTVAGLLVFGKAIAHRRLFPMVRVDYIRVSGNEWISNPEERFTTIDMRGPLILTLSRAYSAISDDLPKGFLLHEGELQAKSKGLPGRVLREVLVNALMHRSYRVHQPIQIIRYGNRIEIKNPGYSLKPEEKLGEPGSQTRNPFIAAIFHETNLAETKGSGIRSMKKLMNDAGFSSPTFESDHGANSFTSRLLLHHFLSEKDLQWLKAFDHDFEFTESQKVGLIFIREAGAIDNGTYRQLTGNDIFKSSFELRQLREKGFIIQKGKGRSTYYVPSEEHKSAWHFFDQLDKLFQNVRLNEAGEFEVIDQKTEPKIIPISAPVPEFSAPALENTLSESDGLELKEDLSAPVEELSAPVRNGLVHQFKEETRHKINALGLRERDKGKLEEIILELCAERPVKLMDLSIILSKQPKYILKKFIQPLMQSGRLKYKIQEMPNHPEQAYITVQ